MAEAGEVEAHYTRRGLAEAILAGLRQSGRDPDRLRPEDLAAVDEFHVRGGRATAELARLSNLRPGMHVLDVGSGLGGSCRHLVSNYGCHATGVDLTREYCEVAALLSERLGMADRTTFRPASALDLPFAGNSFDFVWTEHVQMNVEDKARFYGEIERVLRPEGRFAFHDIFRGPGGDVHYPTPWARNAGISFLVPPGAASEIVGSLGFRIEHWQDVSEPALEWFHELGERRRREGPAPLGLHLLMGEDAPVKFGNMLRNLRERRVTVVQAVLVLDGRSTGGQSDPATPGIAH